MALLHIKCLPCKHRDLSSDPLSIHIKPGTAPRVSVIQELPQQDEKQTGESPETLRPASLGYPVQTGDLVSNKMEGKDWYPRLPLNLHTCTLASVWLHSHMWTDTHRHIHHTHPHSQKIAIQIENISDIVGATCCVPPRQTQVLNGIVISMWVFIVFAICIFILSILNVLVYFGLL